MARRTRPGSMQSTVRAAYEAAGGLDCVSADTGLAASTLSYGTEVREDRPGGLGLNYADRLSRMHKSVAAVFAQHFALLGEGVFMPVDLDGVAGADVHKMLREVSDVLELHSKAHSPGSDDPDDYTLEEAQAQLIEVDEMIAQAVALRSVIARKAGAR